MKNWAVILGASSGIGLECALRLAKKGINIYGLYLRKKSNKTYYGEKDTQIQKNLS